MNQKKPTDWELIELDYRSGIKSLRQIGAEHGVSEGAIRKRAKRDDWSRDLSAKIKDKADDLVRKEAVRSEVRTESATEKEVIEANAEMQASIILAHRSDIRRNRELSKALLAELEKQTGDHGLYDELATLLHSKKKVGDKALEQFRRVMNTPHRIDSAKKLAETLKILIGLEREAFGIDANKTAGQTLDEFLDSIATAEG